MIPFSTAYNMTSNPSLWIHFWNLGHFAVLLWPLFDFRVTHTHTHTHTTNVVNSVRPSHIVDNIDRWTLFRVGYLTAVCEMRFTVLLQPLVWNQ